MRELQRQLNIPLSTLEYHLDYLQKTEIIAQEDDRRYCRYFSEEYSKEEKVLLSALRQKRLREIILLVLSEGQLCFKDIINEVSIAASTLSHYLKLLTEREILIKDRLGTETCYRLMSEKNVVYSLLCYKTSFVDSLVDKVLSSFLEVEYTR